MDFSLSSSLVGSAVSNPDKLALDLQFAADKTLTARKGPTPVFTRGSAGTFVGSDGLIQSAAINAPRFDHDPVTGVCKGLLMEEARTNASWYSGAIVVGTGWGATEVTSSVDGLGPDGNNAYQITETTATSLHSFSNSGGSGSTGATSIVTGTTYTGSIFIKKVSGSVDWVQLTFSSAGFVATQYANFNIGAGTLGNSSVVIPRIENYGNGWYRCSITGTATITSSTSVNLITAFVNNTNGTTRLPSYAGNTTNKILAALVQFEAGSFATSYIPTTTASVIRSADVCSISGSNFTSFYNTTEGSFATSSIFNAPASSLIGQVVFDVNDTTASNRTRLLRNAVVASNFLGYSNTVNGSQDVAITGTVSIISGQVSKMSCCMKANDFAAYLNNASQGTDVMGSMQSAPTTLTIGDVSAGAVRAPINGTIASIKYYRKRLPNAKLQALTV